MPALDTQVIFAFNPDDKHHKHSVKVLEEAKTSGDYYIPEFVVLELILVLRSKGIPCKDIVDLLSALEVIMKEYRLRFLAGFEVKDFADAVKLLSEGVTLFDALIAVLAKRVDGKVVSDDQSFDRLGVTRIPFSR
ncbi:MAG: PIN domain-containing protein [Candidatus Jordarchaeales archaeon]